MTEADMVIRDIHGERVAIVLNSVPDDAPELVREGLARRNIVNSGGRCPCGAQIVFPNRAQRRAAQRSGEILHASVEHENDCPAVDATLLAAIRTWRG